MQKGYRNPDGTVNVFGRMKPGLEATVSPTTHDITWAAGLFEGEGSVASRGQCAVAQMSQKDVWVLQRFKELFGGSISAYTCNGDRQTAMNKWMISGARARGFLMTIYGRLSPRRKEQVRGVLNVGR